MKEYKIDLSMYDGKEREVVNEAVQRHAFELGYKWCAGGESLKSYNAPLLYFGFEGCITFRSTKTGHWAGDKRQEISASDFFALTPEDVQDDVITTTEPADWLLITQGKSRQLVPMGVTIRNTEREPLSIEFFTRTVAERFLPKEESK